MSLQKPWIGLALVFAAFSPALVSSFHFDDYYMLADPAVTSASGWWEVFRLERTRPLTYLTFWGNYAVGGEGPFGYHLVNLLLHIFVALLVWLVFRRVLPVSAALAGAAVFALHPLQTESVAYVFARSTLLATLFCLLCWLAWMERRYWISTAYFAAALLAKEEAIAFPLFLAVFEYLYRRQAEPDARWRTPFLVMIATASAAAVRLLYAASVTEGSGAAFDLGPITPVTYALTQARVLWEYARLVVLPYGQNFDPDVALSTGWDVATAGAWAALTGVTAACVVYTRKHPNLFWVLGGLILLAPSSSVLPLADLMAERRMYLPMLSFAAGIGVLFAKLDAALHSRAVGDPLRPPGSGSSATGRSVAARLGVACTAAIIVLSALSWQRSQVWRSEGSLWRDTAVKSPAKVRPKLQLARALAAKGPAYEAEQLGLLEQAARLAPDDPDVTTEIGVYFLQHGDASGALKEFQKALDKGADASQGRANRGAALYMLGRIDEAVHDFELALAQDACNFDARNNLILARRNTEDIDAVRRLAVVPDGCRFSGKQKLALEAARP